MQRRDYQLRYYGTDTEDHTIDAEQLGKALVAFSALEKTLHSENKLKEGITIEVRVKAMREGSIVIDIASTLQGIAFAPGLLTKENAGLFFGATGLTIPGFIKWMASKTAPQKQNDEQATDASTITNVAHGDYASFNQNAGDVHIHHHHHYPPANEVNYQPFFTKTNLGHVKDITAPALNGKDAGLVLNDGEESVEVNHEIATNIRNFELPEESDVVDHFDDTVTIQTASFKESGKSKFKWSLESAELNGEIKAIIEDPDLEAIFQQSVLQNSRVLDVRIKRVCSRPSPGAKKQTKYYVTGIYGVAPQLPIS